jgi:hypothetical protein
MSRAEASGLPQPGARRACAGMLTEAEAREAEARAEERPFAELASHSPRRAQPLPRGAKPPAPRRQTLTPTSTHPHRGLPRGRHEPAGPCSRPERRCSRSTLARCPRRCARGPAAPCRGPPPPPPPPRAAPSACNAAGALASVAPRLWLRQAAARAMGGAAVAVGRAAPASAATSAAGPRARPPLPLRRPRVDSSRASSRWSPLLLWRRAARGRWRL